jgi:hypothetical protein
MNVVHGLILRLICGDYNNYSPHNVRRIMRLFTAKSPDEMDTRHIVQSACYAPDLNLTNEGVTLLRLE